MQSEDADIVARITRAGTGTSAGALLAHLATGCGHIEVDRRVIALGYRFHAELGDDIPAFFNKRLHLEGTNIAVTLQAGIAPDGSDDPFSGCRTTGDAAVVIDAGMHHASIWRAAITIGVQLRSIEDIATQTFLADHPLVFSAIAGELVALGMLTPARCGLCRATGVLQLPATGT